MISPFSEKTTFYDRLVAERSWDEATNPYETARRLELVFGRLLAGVSLRGKRFLDAGSGGGHFSAAAGNRGAEVYSLDVGKHLLKQVIDRCDSRPVIGNILHLPFPEDVFEVVLSTEVIVFCLSWNWRFPMNSQKLNRMAMQKSSYTRYRVFSVAKSYM